jgi:DNA modification methylase
MTEAVQQERYIEYISIDEIKPADLNPKRHADEVIGDSYDRFGYTEPSLMDERTGKLVAGHGRLNKLQEKRKAGEGPPEGITQDWKMPVVRGWASKSDEEAGAYLVASNRLTELGGWDNKELLSILDSLDDLDGIGYTLEQLQELSASVTELPPTPQTDPDAVPAPPKTPITKRGDVWLLGTHRILCGDSRDFNDVEKLMNGEKVNVAFTSPPYASQRKYDESSGFKPIPPDEYVEWFDDVQANVRAVLADDGSWFVNIKEHCDDGERHLYVKDLTIAHKRQWVWKFVDEMCWVDTRNGVHGGWNNRFKDAWEPVFHFATEGPIKFNPLANGRESEGVFDYSPDNGKSSNGSGLLGEPVGGVRTGLARPSNVIQIAAMAAAGVEHSAQFPVALPQWFIKAYSDIGDNIYDPFMGSGTTLIAAHQENRNAFGCEISASYTDVICKRFQELTGIEPILESTGEPVSFASDSEKKT